MELRQHTPTTCRGRMNMRPVHMTSEFLLHNSHRSACPNVELKSREQPILCQPVLLLCINGHASLNRFRPYGAIEITYPDSLPAHDEEWIDGHIIPMVNSQVPHRRLCQEH